MAWLWFPFKQETIKVKAPNASLVPQAILDFFNVSVEHGLSLEQVKQQVERYGANQLLEQETNFFFKNNMFCNNCIFFLQKHFFWIFNDFFKNNLVSFDDVIFWGGGLLKGETKWFSMVKLKGMFF